jgi:hypothetical protein
MGKGARHFSHMDAGEAEKTRKRRKPRATGRDTITSNEGRQVWQ